MKKKTTEAKETTVAKREEPSKELSQMMAVSKEDQALMYGDMGSEDVSIPRLAILQGLSPEVSEGQGNPGDFFVKGLGLNLGKGPLEIIPIMRSKSRIKWRSLDQGGGIMCQSRDGKNGLGDPGGYCGNCPEADWVGSKKPGCDLYQNIIVVVRNHEDWIPMALSGSRTKLKVLKDFNTLLLVEIQKQRALFCKAYTLKGVNRSGPNNTKYFNFSFHPANDNKILDEAEIKRGFQVFNSLKGKNIEVMQDQEDQERNSGKDMSDGNY